MVIYGTVKDGLNNKANLSKNQTDEYITNKKPYENLSEWRNSH